MRKKIQIKIKITNINTLKLIINSPLEQFEVTNLLGFNAPIFGYFHLNLTNLSLYSILVLLLIISIHYIILQIMIID